jgi:hypothetical protein
MQDCNLPDHLHQQNNKNMEHILPNELKQQSLSLSTFKYLLYRYYNTTAININYESENPRTWKSICLKCNAARSLATPLSCCS